MPGQEENVTLDQIYQQTVEIEGKEYFVSTVERQAGSLNSPFKVGTILGLIVKAVEPKA